MQTNMKNWCWASAWIFGLSCAVNGGIGGLIGGGLIGFIIGALLCAAAAFIRIGIRLALWAGALGIAVLLLTR